MITVLCVTPEVLTIIFLKSQRNHFQKQCQELSALSSEAKGRNSSLEKERDSLKNEVVMLKQVKKIKVRCCLWDL